MNSIDWNKFITFSFSGLALGISLLGIYITRKNLKKQLRLAKLEEILEILYYLNGYYNQMYLIFEGFEEAIDDLKESDEIQPKLIETIKYRNGFIEVVNKEIIIGKITRLKILSNAYLSNKDKNKLKLKINAIGTIFYDIYIFIHLDGKNPFIRKKHVTIPYPNQMHDLLNSIMTLLIEEMNLGYSNLKNADFKDYLEKQFKNDIENPNYK
ncbi:hypothetical protein [Flavobacterium beibuense]|uniref:hypothetical protein n=1 Tax=Flavobacterium beibuense TaxID=657326 RepID=UPI003A8EEBFF